MAQQVTLRASRLIGPQPALASMLSRIVEVLFLCLPALFNQGPLIFADTRAYYLGGRAALDKLELLFFRQSVGGATEALDTTLQKARGIRSAFYSLFVYLPAHVGLLWLIVLAQAAIVAFVIRLAFDLLCPDQPKWHATAIIVMLGLGTTLPWTVSVVMPDVFTGIMALCLILTILCWNALTPWIRLVLFVTIAGSVVMHVTNLAVAVGLLVFGLLVSGWRQPGRYLFLGGAIGLSAAAMMAVGVVGFHQWSMAPHAPPFLLARSIADGPAKAYLRDHCPEINLVMCRHLGKLDVWTGAFLWDKDGVYTAASPTEQAEIRAEEKRIYVAAALEHPWMQLQAMVRNTVVQLRSFMLSEYNIPSFAEYDDTDMRLYIGSKAELGWQPMASIPNYVGVIVSLGYLLYVWRQGGLRPVQQQLLYLVLATVLIGSLAGAFSEPTPRYEARVIWLLPMVALLLADQHFMRRRI